MRIANELAGDLNLQLTPEWPSLTARAKGAVYQIPATNWRQSETSKAPGFVQFEVTFKDDSKASVFFGRGKSKLGSWVIWVGGVGRKHDLLSDYPLDPVQVISANDSWEIKSSTGSLFIDRSQGTFFAADLSGKMIWSGANRDLLVGDVSVSPTLFKHSDGFGVSLDFDESHFVFGGGEQFSNLNWRGRVYDVMNSDALGVNGQLRYQSTPFFLSDRGLALAMLQCEPGRIDFGSRRHGVMTFSSDGDVLGLFLSESPDPKASIDHWRTLMGGVTGVPDWSYGLWLSRCFYKNETELNRVIQLNSENELNASVINLDARAWMRADTRTDFVWDLSRWSPYEKLIPLLRSKGFHVCLWENPYVSSATESLYLEGSKLGYFAKTSSGEVYPYQWVPTGLEGFPQPPIAGLVDFTNPKACKWWKDLHRPFLRAGVTCFKTDFGEEIPFDACFFDGSTGRQLRNVYSDLYNSCVMEVIREECGEEGIIWARSGFAKMGRTPVKWAGDSQTSWNALRASLRGGLSQAIGGAVYWSHDIGGFYGPMPTPELYLRWAQIGLWGSHARMHGTTPREPWEFGTRVMNQVRIDVERRHRLRRFFVESGKTCQVEQQSFLKPLWLYHFNDLACFSVEDQFFSGSCEVMIAPFVSESGGRTVYLPEGRWVLLANQNRYEGKASYFIDRTEDLPVFVLEKSKWLKDFLEAYDLKSFVR